MNYEKHAVQRRTTRLTSFKPGKQLAQKLKLLLWLPRCLSGESRASPGQGNGLRGSMTEGPGALEPELRTSWPETSQLHSSVPLARRKTDLSSGYLTGLSAASL